MRDTDAMTTIGNISIDRRTALKVSGGSIAASVLGSALVLDAQAQETSMEAANAFFTTPMATTIGAIAEQYWPTTETSAGAIDAGVVTYIDRALAGPYSGFQNTYRVGIDWINAASEEQFGATFANAEPEQQLELLTAVFEEGAAAASAAQASPVAATPEVVPDMVATPDVDEGGALVDDGKGTLINATSGTQATSLLAFLNIVRTHTMEGLFSDPVHGGNRNFAGWSAVGYPGPYVYYDEAQQQSFEPLNQPLQSIADL